MLKMKQIFPIVSAADKLGFQSQNQSIPVKPTLYKSHKTATWVTFYFFRLYTKGYVSTVQSMVHPNNG
jgi:hypothetical protein